LFDFMSSLRESTAGKILILDAPDQSSELMTSLLDIVTKTWDLSVMTGSFNHMIESQDDQITIDIDALYSLDHRKHSFGRIMDSRIAEIKSEYPDGDQRQLPLIDEAFENIMTHTIKGSTHENLAMPAFDVVRHAFLPLRGYPFKRAVRHILRHCRPHSTTHPTITDAIGATGGLLIIETNSVITWFHPSISGFFERTHTRWFPSGHACMATACLSVLITRTVETDEDEDGEWATGSFLAYAGYSWGRHLRACSPNLALEDMALTYLRDDESIKARKCVRSIDPAGRYGVRVRRLGSFGGGTRLLPLWSHELATAPAYWRA
jgi:hypothetical protein